MLYSEIINKPVLDITAMRKLGELDGVYISKTHSITHYSTNNSRYIPIECVNAVNDVITVALSPADTEADAPQGIRLPDIGEEIIDTSGKLVGKVEGYAFTRDDRLKSILTAENAVSSKRIIKFGAEDILIKGKNCQKIGANSEIRGNKEDKNDGENYGGGYPFDSAELDENGMITPKIISNYDFLIGRRLLKDIRKNNVVIAPKGMIIDSECVKKTSEAGKLVELAIYSDR